MSNAVYFPNSALARENINKLISNYNLQEFTDARKKEKVYKNEDLIVFLTKKYIFMRTYLSEDTQIVLNAKKILTEGVL